MDALFFCLAWGLAVFVGTVAESGSATVLRPVALVFFDIKTAVLCFYRNMLLRVMLHI
ncbi:MAG: hypothetical protein JW937_09120 [Candidatus Omnitrophica bacterium]|nr:hypothetical protein [Candidatus Omnitrophota bacterium]